MAHRTVEAKEELKGVLNLCRYVAGSYQIKAAFLFGDYAFGLFNSKVMQVMLIINNFQPKIISYLKTLGEKSVLAIAVDQWVFERDVDRGFLGEALAGGMLFPYIPLLNAEYLHAQEVKLKKRIITELFENLVLDFPELSHEILIKPEYFLYESLLRRARLFPPAIYSILNFMHESVRKQNIESVLAGYLEALKELEKETIVNSSGGYIRISRDFIEKARKRKIRFTIPIKTAQKALFGLLLGIFPKILSSLSQNLLAFPNIQRTLSEDDRVFLTIEDPQKYLFVPTARGLVPLANRVSIETFAKEVLSADENVKVERMGGVLNDAYRVKAYVDGQEKSIVVKKFRDWSSFKWFPLALWAMGTRAFAVLGSSRLERECAINQLLSSKGFNAPKLLHVNHAERLLFMEYIEGENLEKVIKRIMGQKTTNISDKDLTVIKEVGKKIAEIHALNVSLGDTKPENILVGRDGEIYLLDFEQASRNGDQAWDIAEFLYYAGHYAPPLDGNKHAELITKYFIEGYLESGGKIENIRRAGSPKYTKVFSVFTLPNIILTISNICKKTHGKRE
ncbi:MAG: lipopolysaccharide kinase InaA family protein [Candidatus Bathyarchaeia archaeon]